MTSISKVLPEPDTIKVTETRKTTTWLSTGWITTPILYRNFCVSHNWLNWKHAAYMYVYIYVWEIFHSYYFTTRHNLHSLIALLGKNICSAVHMYISGTTDRVFFLNLVSVVKPSLSLSCDTDKLPHTHSSYEPTLITSLSATV